ncbi:hypothetical protein B0I33_107119 [Prauserella shujinwangii]|uniref:Uncharacterized protein n=1 Tax=Prauserella shujinwangii TaxID=1453103 RepID=A0A2T0LSE3_9PSEU|nr:hypothetical protein [Prauserella shujinwangii]PRX46542.1 hypothetical protein B0I33_107119 [Prauserella shujinwangii]
MAALVVVVAGSRGVAGILGPIFPALVRTVAVSPLGGLLRRRGVPA